MGIVNWHLVQFLSIYFLFVSIEMNAQAGIDRLQLSDQGLKIENRIEIEVPVKVYKSIKKNDDKKTHWKGSKVVVNGVDALLKEVHTRGSSSHHFRRKSLSLTFEKSIEIRSLNRNKQFKHIYALNLVWDKYYVNNRLAFGLMEKIGLSGLFNSYAEIVINGKSEGIYLLLERPQDWALKKQKSPFVIRRGYDHRIDKEKIAHQIDSVKSQKYHHQYLRIYLLLDKYKGEELFNQLSNLMDLDMYMHWMAFNFLFQNGDYSDEIYLYIDPFDEKFKLIPWDYDDILGPEPHEGSARRDSLLADKLIYSSEDVLDLGIANDEYLYAKYLEQLKILTSKLTPEILKIELEKTYTELFPYYSNEKIMRMNKYDWYNNADLENLVEELNWMYTHLVNTRDRTLEKLNK